MKRRQNKSNIFLLLYKLSAVVGAITIQSAIAQQITKGARNAQPKVSRIALSEPALAKSWERPTTATKFKFSPDGETLLTNGAKEQSAELWSLRIGNFQTGKYWEFPQNLSPTSGQSKVIFSPDAQQMATSPSDRTIEILR